jgi:predicted RNA-binding Zn-ribbon protein involved in translation (DUF1610 family)
LSAVPGFTEQVDSGPKLVLSESVEEMACPNCGQTMLSAWGSTCGNCRPRLALPKTIYLSPQDVCSEQAGPGLCLGWFAILSSPDESKTGLLIELVTPVTVFSRGGALSENSETWIDINDKFISSGHAVVSRPHRNQKTEAFSIRDRYVPGPSANGTFVNSSKLKPADVVELSEGDVVRIGRTEMVFKSLWLEPVGVQSR